MSTPKIAKFHFRRLAQYGMRLLQAVHANLPCEICHLPLGQETPQNFGQICQSCACYLSPMKGSQCSICAQLLMAEADLDTLICPTCQDSLPDYDRAFSAFVYQYPLDRLLWHIKYQANTVLLKSLASLAASELAASLKQEMLRPTLVIATPMHRLRLKERGYNPAVMIGQTIAKRFGAAFCKDLISRVKSTPRLATLSPKKRRMVLNQAFDWLSDDPVIEEKLSGIETVCIVDDILTTGATASEIARLIKQKFMVRVILVTIARAL